MKTMYVIMIVGCLMSAGASGLPLLSGAGTAPALNKGVVAG